MTEIHLLPIKILLMALDFVLMLFTFAWVKTIIKFVKPASLRSVPVDPDVPSHRVNANHKEERLTTPYPGVTTLYELQQRSQKVYSTRHLLGSRVFLGQKSPKVKEFALDIKWRTFAEVGYASQKFGAALRASGVVPAPPATTLDKLTTPCSLAIFENTCAEWLIAALGSYSQSVSVTTIYATLGMDAVIDAVNDGVIAAILCNKKSVKSLLGRAKEMPTLKTIVYTNDMVAPDDTTEYVPSNTGKLKVMSFEDFVESGDTDKFPPTPPSPDTTAVIMYTSGSTGKPKGVIATHGNVLAAVGSAMELMEFELGKDVYLGYLPLAHILEFTAEMGMLAAGCTICFADPKTLTATGSYPIGALEAFSPTVMAGVPKVWDLIKKGVQAKVSASPKIAQFLVETAFQARTFAIDMGYIITPLFDLLIFRKFSKVVGGKLRAALSGGGPLNSEVQVFVRTCFGCPLFQGYGLTETCAVLSIQDPYDLRAGVAGVPAPSVEVKLESTPEITDKGGLPYLSTDTKDVNGDPVFGRGEILVKGASMSRGYYMMPDKTREDFGTDTDGFFHTGDIGQFLSDGSLRIVDRKKNLVKLHGGEYVAIESMEGAYGNSKFVDAAAGGICCYGDGEMDRPVAMIQLNETVAMRSAGELGIPGDFETVKQSKEFHDHVLADMQQEGKKAGLSHLEKIVAVSFLNDPWTPENGCLTAANKLQRRMVIEKFEKEFNEVRQKGIFK